MFLSFEHLTQAPGEAAHGKAVAILPLGAMEAHGPHLPLATDTLIATGILDHAAGLDASADPVLCLPPLWLGASAEHSDRAGTLSAEPEALVAQIEAIAEGLARCGVKRVLLFNGHGGNVAAASMAVLKLRRRFAMLAASVHWLDYGLPEGLTPPASARDDIHGGWIETSVMMHLMPQLVGNTPAAAEPAPPARSLFPSGPVNWGWMMSDLARDGWVGRPELATAEIGQRLVDHAARKVLETLGELAAADWRPTAP